MHSCIRPALNSSQDHNLAFQGITRAFTELQGKDQTLSDSSMQPRSHTHTHTHSVTHTRTHTPRHAHTLRHTQTHTQIHTSRHTHTHTHTHTQRECNSGAPPKGKEGYTNNTRNPLYYLAVPTLQRGFPQTAPCFYFKF